MTPPLLLLPVPRQLALEDGIFALPKQRLLVVDAPDVQTVLHTANVLSRALRAHAEVTWELAAGNGAPDDLVGAVLRVTPGVVGHAQGYSLTVAADHIELIASTPAGLFYGVQTLAQILSQVGGNLPKLRCVDWPDYAQRGVMLDISRNKVPTLQTLKHLIDLLASWKVNQLQFYTEHTFAYRSHPAVWADASPLTGEEILALDRYCCERYIELTPNQNSFGHMGRWLALARYRSLAEAPDGCDMPWGREETPFSLNPTDPASLEFLSSLYDELLPHFSSRQINVGCDETFDLGQGRSKARVAEVGAGRVYLEFLLKIYRMVKRRGHTMQFWADIILNHSELVPEIPHDAIALVWGYTADYPFDEQCAILARSGIPFYVCPGTSSWNSIGGRTENAVNNIRNAAENGLRYGAVGLLNTDWGDNGHWQPLPVSYPAFLYGAGASWCLQANQDMDLPTMLNRFAFQDSSEIMGAAAVDLGNIYLSTRMHLPNGSVLFELLQRRPEQIASWVGSHGITDPMNGLRAALMAVEQAAYPLERVEIRTTEGAQEVRELRWVAKMLRHACWRGTWALTRARGVEHTNLRQELIAEADDLIAEFQEIWHARNRPGGYQVSVAMMQQMRADYAL